MKTRIRFFYAISILILFQGIFSLYKIDFITKLISEALIFSWLLFEMPRMKFVFPRIITFLGIFYLIWVFFVTVLHNDNLIEIYLFSRYFILSAIVMYISFNVKNLKQYSSSILRAINVIVSFEILASIFMFFIEGRLERNVGTMASSGGGLASVWPLTFAPYYFLRIIIKGKWKDVILTAGLVFIGYASAKRGVYFLIPLSLVIIYYGFLGSKIFIKSKGSKRRFLFSAGFLFLILLLGISGTESLARGNGFSLRTLSSAFDYVGEYSNNENVMNGESIGRSSSSLNVFNSLLEDNNALFGNGVKTLKGEISYSKYNVGYGITGFAKELISVGIVGGVLYLFFYTKLLTKIRKGKRYFLEFDEEFFWIWILGVSGLISLIITVLTYGRIFSQSLNPIIFVLIAVGISLRIIKATVK